MENGKLKRILVKVLKIFGWITLSIVVLLIGISLAIQIPAVQNKLVQKAITFLETKIGTEVRLAHISISFPKTIVLDGLYLEDQSKDTLLYAGKLSINTDLWALTQKRIQLNDLSLDSLAGFISRNRKDSAFNFNYIVKAFSDTTAQQPKDTTTTPWDFSIGSIALHQAHVAFIDPIAGNDLRLRLGKLDIDVNEFDLNRAVIDVDEINLSDVVASFEQSKTPVTHQIQDSAQTADEPFPYDLGFATINLENIKANYAHHVLGQIIRINLHEATVEAEEFDLKNQVIDLNELRLADVFVMYHQQAVEPLEKEKVVHDSPVRAKPWTLKVDDVDLKKNIVQYYDFNKPALDNGIDFSRLWITELNFDAEDLSWDGVNAHGDIHECSFHDRSGFSLSNLQGEFALEAQLLALKKFVFETPHSHIAMSVTVSGDSISSLGTTYPDAKVNVDIARSVLSFRDIAYFAPSVLKDLPVKLPATERVTFAAKCDGRVNDLQIDRLQVEALSQTALDLTGHLVGLPDMKQLQMNVDLEKLYTTRQDLHSVLPDSLLPKSIRIPNWMNLSGDLKGSLVKPQIAADLASDYGKASVKARLNLDSTMTKENYAGTVDIDRFNLGKLLMQEKTIGVLDLQASINGAGLKLNDLDAVVNVKVNDFVYNAYHYKDFRLKGSVDRYFFSGEAKLSDTNLDFVLKGDLDYNGDTPHYKMTFDLKNVDFQALNLTERELRARLKMDVDMESSDFKVMNGNLDIREVAVYNGKTLYAVDSLLFASLDQEGRSELSIRSDILTGDFKGTLNLFGLPGAIRRHFNQYFSLQDTAYDKPVAPQNFEFSLVLKNTDLLTEVLLPDLEPFIPGKISGKFDSEAHQLDMEFGVADVQYGNVKLDSITIKVDSDKDKLWYNFGIRNVVMDTMQISALRLSGSVEHDSIHTDFHVVDRKDKDKYLIGGVIRSIGDSFRFRLLNDELILNYESWQAPDDNYLAFGKKGMLPHNFEISKAAEKLSVVRTDDRDSTISVEFKSFDLSNLTHFVEGTTPAAGIMDGDVNISVAEKGAFNSYLVVHHFNLLEQEWGDLALALGRTSTGPFNIDVRVEGENATLKAAGYIVTKGEAQEIHFETTIDKFNLAITEPLTMGQLKNVSGQLVGHVKIDGKMNQPDIDGSITFKEAKFVPTSLNSQFVLNDEQIIVNRSGLTLDDFTILDQRNNEAVIDGKIASSTFTTFGLDLVVRTKNFQLLNSTIDDNDLFFGKVGLNMRAVVTGTTDLPHVTMNASLTKDSEFTYVVPQSEKGVLEQKGIVVFVDRDAKNDPFLSAIKPEDTLSSGFKGMELTANIELSEFETFNIVIDPATGDRLSVNGNATLTMNMDPTGDMDLSGRYEVVKGFYDMSFYKLVKRKFDLEKGGTIIWSGDPLNAMMDLRAIYQVETSPMELVSNQIDVTNQSEMNMYRQQLPFLVYLQIRGELLGPEISFLLDMPERERNAFGGNIYAKILDINTRESDLNKQVFSLLVLKRFMSDNPFESQGGDVETTARRSVSKLLTEQLNRLSQNVKGVELSVDVKSYEDFSSGSAQGQTELQLGVSKTLLNDRLVVKVSGNVDVEGDASQQSGFADYIGDLALEYKLTEDGRFRIVGFRNSDYDMIDGELIETGAGLIYIKDYNALRELFKANVKEE
jgi:translocation and assembly module TamB